MNSFIVLLGAVAAGIVVQSILTYRQTAAFNAAIRDLRQFGSVAVGGGGKRYRGGKAFVAIAADRQNRVTKAIILTGWTTFARPRELLGVRGLGLARLERGDPVTSIDDRSRAALQNAAQTLQTHLARQPDPQAA
jgi:DNA-binding transcriptional regulator of glucitol operon